MTIREFFESKEKLAIHCPTRKQAKTLLKAFDKMGYKWGSGLSYTDYSCWEAYEEETCYSNNGGYCNEGWCRCVCYTILEFADIEEMEVK